MSTPFHFQHISQRGTCGKTRVVPQNRRPRPQPAEMGARHACVVVDVWGRGDVEPLVGLAVRLRALGAEVRVCAPPDCAERLTEVGVPLVPLGLPVRQLLDGATRPGAQPS